MNFKLIFLLILLFKIEGGSCQYYEKPSAKSSTAAVELGKPYPVVDAMEKLYFYKDGEILAIKLKGSEIIMQKLDADLLTFKQVRVHEDMPAKYRVEGIGEFNNRYYFFYSLYDSQNEKEQLFSREINFDDLSFKGEGKRIVAVDGKIVESMGGDGKSFWSFLVKNKFDFQYSYDHSKMLIQYRMKPRIKRDSKSHDIIGLCVFDENLEPLWNQEVEMPYTEKKMNNVDYSIDSDGNTYILTTVFDDKSAEEKKNKEGEANYHIELLRIKANSNKLEITPIHLKDKFISSIALFENPSNDMICAGFYNKGVDLNDASGMLMFKVGFEGELKNMSTYEIPVEVLNRNASHKVQRKNSKAERKDKAEFQNIALENLIVEKDGSIIMVGEQAYTKTYYTYVNGRSSSYTMWFYNDMLITKIDPEGKLAWMEKLPKKQKGGAGRGGMSYKYMAGESSHYLLFLDNKKNMRLTVNDVPVQHLDGQGGFLTAYKINDTNGEVSKVSLFDTRDVKGIAVYQFKTSRIIPLSDGENWWDSKEFVVEVYKKKKEDVLIKARIN